ncbi:MAG: PHP domain-containing protein, partial [Acetobacteraceae bacterium]|nr:PHP domain-containing protein [Acetobacteraceae bacterium]
MQGFVHLRVHSAYSLSEGAIKIDKIATLAREAAMPAVALTDTANLFGALEFSDACAKKGIQPILGLSLPLMLPNRAVRPGLPPPKPERVGLLAANEAGLANLMRLSSRAFLDPPAGAEASVPVETLLEHAEGLFLLTGGGEGPLGRLLEEGQVEAAAALMERLAGAFGDRALVEITRLGTARDAASEPGFLMLAERFGLPLVATNPCYFATPAMAEAHDALLCIAEGRVLAEQERRRASPEQWFKPADQMRALFADMPDAADNTLAVARRCAVMALPRKPLLPVSRKVGEGRSEAETVSAMARAGLAARMEAIGADEATRRTYEERLGYELGVIERMGFSGYFLIVADFIQWAKANRIAVGPGRGSGAGSVAAWALTITDLDPIRFGLLFERFLNPERVSMP